MLGRSEGHSAVAAGPAMAAGRAIVVHIAELDGVRAIAIWMVLLNHSLLGWPTALAPVPRWLGLAGRWGWLGVDLFFVLSGFLITGILVKSRNQPRYFRNFYARRVLRIFPLFYVVIFASWAFYGLGYSSYFLGSFFFLSNFALPFGWSIPFGPAVFWSLAVEEHFYLLWPWLVRFLSPAGLAMAAGSICVLQPLIRWWGAGAGSTAEEIHYLTYFRLDGLALGALLAIWMQSRWASRTSTLLLSAAMLALCAAVTLLLTPFGILESGSVFRYNQADMLFGAFLMAVLGLRNTGWTSPLRCRFAKWTANLSYCVYLIHLTASDAVLSLSSRLGWQWEPLGALGVYAIRAIVMVALAFGIAAVSYRFFEQPVLRLKRHFE